MAIIKEDYVSFEIAKLLKEKGFNCLCNAYYDCFTTNNFHSGCEPTDFNSIDTRIRKIVSAPTLQMAMRWLRDIHNIIIEPESVWNGKKWEYLLFVITPQNADSPYYEHNPYKSYEECVETSIKYSLENLI